MCMKFYDDTTPLYLETHAPGTNCPKDTAPDNTILCPIVFVSKSLSGAERRYSNIEHEALGILHGLEKFYHHCFGRRYLLLQITNSWYQYSRKM